MKEVSQRRQRKVGKKRGRDAVLGQAEEESGREEGREGGREGGGEGGAEGV